MTTDEKPRFTVGKTDLITIGPGQSGHGFTVVNARGAPLVTIAFKTSEESKEAEEAVRKALRGAVNIKGHG